MSDRRTFMTSAAAGLAALGLAPRRIRGAEGKARLAYRDLGSTGYKVTEIGMGCMNMRDPELVRAAIDSGINYIDTAHGYMNGVNEQVVGQVMKDRRNDVWLTTKIRRGGEETSLQDMPGMLETSLKRLNTDHVDLVLLHVTESREEILENGVMKVFEDYRTRGLTRFVGVSTHENQAEVLDATVESTFWQAVLVGYNFFSPAEVRPAIARAREAGIAIIGMKNLLNPASRPWNKLDDIRSDEQKAAGISPEQALIKWVLDDPNVDTTIPGVTSFEQLAQDIDVMGMTMTFEDRDVLRKFGEKARDVYCRGVAGCTGCREQCPYGVAVNEINRCLNYAEGYGDARLAWENYRELPAGKNLAACGDCDECVVRCVNGLDLNGNIRRARQLFA